MIFKRIFFTGLFMCAQALAGALCEEQNPTAYGTPEEMPTSDAAKMVQPKGVIPNKVGYFVPGTFVGAMFGPSKYTVKNKDHYLAIPGGITTTNTLKMHKKITQFELVVGMRKPKAPLVMGTELTLGWANAKMSQSYTIPGFPPASKDTVHTRYNAALTALAGFPIADRVMPFLKVGPVGSATRISYAPQGKTKTMPQIGLMAGAGAEIAITSHIGIRVEGAYRKHLPRKSKNLTTATGSKFTSKPEVSAWSVTGGIHVRAF